MKEITINYKSNTFMPDVIELEFIMMKNRILRDNLEADKILGHIEHLRSALIMFLSENGEME